MQLHELNGCDSLDWKRIPAASAMKNHHKVKRLKWANEKKGWPMFQ
jgi:hypothetical protein